jgi:hypothetical protein
MKMVGHKTESIYRRYAIADERSMSISSMPSTSSRHKLQSNFKVSRFYEA